MNLDTSGRGAVGMVCGGGRSGWLSGFDLWSWVCSVGGVEVKSS